MGPGLSHQPRLKPGHIFPVLLTVIFLLSGCKEEPPVTITAVDFETAEFADFVEPDFPFVTTSMDGRDLGEGFPEDNIASRCLAIQLGNHAYACFDMDMLRWSVAWTGDFLPMVTMAQISYNDFHEKNNQVPVIGGDPKIATGLYPGWSGASPVLMDPRPGPSHPDALRWGPLPREMGRWNGVYRIGQEVVLAYEVLGADIYEKPGSLETASGPAFTRTFQVGSSKTPLSLVAAEVTNGVRSEVVGQVAYIYHGENEEAVTAIGLAGDISGVEIEIIDNQYAVVRIADPGADRLFTTALWQGAGDDKEALGQVLSSLEVDMPDFRKGGPGYWQEEILTKGQVSPDTAPYVMDQLTLPIPNPWSRNVRVVDVAFLGNNRAALVTFEGDVWIVENINDALDRLKWRRYASGLYEPQSIEVVNGAIYVFGKEGIVHLRDLNDDGEVDYYENFSNRMIQSIETREWAADMVAAPEGGFYVAKFGALDMGPETSSPKSLLGFRAGSPHDGSIIKVSEDGESVEIYATGFRGPYLGIHPETGVLSASDQQGHYMPSTPVMLINKGDYYGVPATAHRDPIPEVTPTLVWIPHLVDRSGVSQVWVTSDQMGPLNGEMIHLSYGRPGLFRVMIDSTGQGVQGSVSFLPGHYPAPTMKAAVNPGDGQVYVAGFSLWGVNTSTISAFSRMRYTGMESFLPEKAMVRDVGIFIRFDHELDEAAVSDISRYQVKRWNYKRTEKYGSGHFKLDGFDGEEHLPVLGAYLSDDRKTLFLTVPQITEVMQMEVSYQLRTADGTDFDDQLWFTVNAVVPADFQAKGFSDLERDDLVLEYDPAAMERDTDVEPTVVLGQDVFMKMGCIACHSITDNTGGQMGPGLKGLFGSERELDDGSTVIADAAYVRASILRPGEKIVAGYEAEMPSFQGIIPDHEIESLILYLEALE